MNVKKFILQDENDEHLECNIVTMVNVSKFNSLYLIYTVEGNDDELLFAKINNDSEQLFLESITSNEEISEIEKVLNERGVSNG